MNIMINDDGSVCIKNDSYLSHYDQDGNLKAVIGNLNAPKKIAINYPKKRTSELTYKVSVDTSDLNKLEEQLIRIKQLMQDVSVKPKLNPQFFSQSSGEFFIKDAFINSAEFKGVLVNNKLELDTKAQLDDDAISQIKQNTIAIAELGRVMQTNHQAWADAVNRTWCSQK